MVLPMRAVEAVAAIRIDVGTLSGTGQVRANGQDGKPRV